MAEDEVKGALIGRIIVEPNSWSDFREGDYIALDQQSFAKDKFKVQRPYNGWYSIRGLLQYVPDVNPDPGHQVLYDPQSSIYVFFSYEWFKQSMRMGRPIRVSDSVPTWKYGIVTELYANIGTEGTAAGGGANTITLDGLGSGEPETDDYYNGMVIEIVGGTGEGQIRLITDYDGTTKVATVDVDWDTQPGVDSAYRIYVAAHVTGELFENPGYLFEFGEMSKVVEKELFISGLFSDATRNNLLATRGMACTFGRSKGTLVFAKIKEGDLDTGAPSLVNIVVNGNKVFAAEWQIIGVDTVNDYFEIDGAYAERFPVGSTFVVFLSTGNDGTYTVESVIETGNGSSTTQITVVEEIPDGTVDGGIREYAGIETDNPGGAWAYQTGLLCSNKVSGEFIFDRSIEVAVSPCDGKSGDGADLNVFFLIVEE